MNVLPILDQCFILYQRFSDVFMGYRHGTLGKNGLIAYLPVCWLVISRVRVAGKSPKRLLARHFAEMQFSVFPMIVKL